MIRLALPVMILWWPAGTQAATDRMTTITIQDPVGDGLLPGPAEPHPSEVQRRLIQESIDRNIVALESLGKLESFSLASPLLGWPLRPNNGLADFGYHGTANFVDLDAAWPDHLLDYECGRRTYDLSNGYNHGGIDYINWPFWWNKMDRGEVAVIAAAPGILIGTHDGEYDRSCGLNDNPWNAAYVMHADGSVAWYGHLKNGSVTARPVGSAIAQGEYLGLVGSSGSSFLPHLHFELHDATGRVVEPHAGPCNPGASWWASQRPYFDPAINKMTAGFARPVPMSTCPTPEQPNEATDFPPSGDIYLTTYYRDQRSLAFDPDGATMDRLYDPDGRLVAQWTQTSPVDHYDVSYWYVRLSASQGFDTGTYRWEATYHGVTYVHTFTVSSDAGRYYGECIKGCDTSRQTCDGDCQDECRATRQGEREIGSCISECKVLCIDDERACKDTCQALKEAETVHEP